MKKFALVRTRVLGDEAFECGRLRKRKQRRSRWSLHVAKEKEETCCETCSNVFFFE